MRVRVLGDMNAYTPEMKFICQELSGAFSDFVGRVRAFFRPSAVHLPAAIQTQSYHMNRTNARLMEPQAGLPSR
jgi:hypothetical protein